MTNTEEVYLLEKRMLDDDKDAYKVLAMLLEPIGSETFEKFKNEQEKPSSGWTTDNVYRKP